MQYLKQSTAFTFRIGPFLDDADGKTAETGLTLSQADYRLSKAGGAFAQKNDATAGAHDENGWYTCILNTTDTGTLGTLDVCVSESGALPVWRHFMVVPANVYDSLVAGTDTLQADMTQILGTAVSAPATAGVLDVNIKNIANAAVNTSSAQIGVNVINAAGTAWGSGAITAGAFAQAAADKAWSTAARTLTSVSGLTINSNMTQILGTAVSAPATAGVLDVNIKNIANAAVNTSSAQIGVNVVNAAGTAWGSGAITAGAFAQAAADKVWSTATRTLTSVAGLTIASNVTQIDGQATSGNNATLNLKQLNIVNSAGTAVIASSTGSNGDGIQASGHGTGSGLQSSGGATGDGIKGIGGLTSGSGVSAIATTDGMGINAIGAGSGVLHEGIRAYSAASYGLAAVGAGGMTVNGQNDHGLSITAAGTAKNGVNIAINTGGYPGSTGNGIVSTGAGAAGAGAVLNGDQGGEGLSISGGATGNGVTIAGGATSGDGIDISASTGAGIDVTVTGSGHGVSLTGGISGHGIKALGGVAGGDGAHFEGQNTGSGMSCTGGANGNGALMVGGSGGVSGNGLFIRTSAANSPAFSAVSFAGGNAALFQSVGGDGSGLKVVGVGTGHGFEIVGGATGGKGIKATGGGGSGEGIYVEGAASANGMTIQGGNTGVAGLSCSGGATGGHGIQAVGFGGGMGITATGLYAIEAQGQTTGIKASAVANDGCGIEAVGYITSPGIKATGGGTATNDIEARELGTVWDIDGVTGAGILEVLKKFSDDAGGTLYDATTDSLHAIGANTTPTPYQKYYQYRVKCITEGIYVGTQLLATSPAPTTCPNNPLHVIDAAATAITETLYLP